MIVLSLAGIRLRLHRGLDLGHRESSTTLVLPEVFNALDAAIRGLVASWPGGPLALLAPFDF
jgi:hypothetical protein